MSKRSCMETLPGKAVEMVCCESTFEVFVQNICFSIWKNWGINIFGHFCGQFPSFDMIFMKISCGKFFTSCPISKKFCSWSLGVKALTLTKAYLLGIGPLGIPGSLVSSWLVLLYSVDQMLQTNVTLLQETQLLKV